MPIFEETCIEWHEKQIKVKGKTYCLGRIAMKILMLFVDMLGAEYLNHGNKKCPETAMDRLFKKLGGTFYERCYTPGPDTPRSSACMWSGCYPKANGCNNRLKYPGRYLITDTNLWEMAERGGYTCNLYVRPTINRIGLLPYPYETKVQYELFEDALNNFTISDNSITFFYLPDLHYMMDANGYGIKTMEKGTDIVAECIEKILSRFEANTFDYIMIFSDHGFRITRKKHLIENDRVRTMMFIHKRGDDRVRFDKQIRSNLDIFPTVMDMAGLEIPKNIDGKSLLREGHEYVLIEDHETFSVKLGQTIEHWAVVKDDGKHWLECNGTWEHEHENKDFDEADFERIILAKMDDYDMNSRLWKTLHIYDNNKIENNTYTNGKPIEVSIYNKWLFKMIRRICAAIYRRMRSN